MYALVCLDDSGFALTTITEEPGWVENTPYRLDSWSEWLSGYTSQDSLVSILAKQKGPLLGAVNPPMIPGRDTFGSWHVAFVYWVKEEEDESIFDLTKPCSTYVDVFATDSTIVGQRVVLAIEPRYVPRDKDGWFRLSNTQYPDDFSPADALVRKISRLKSRVTKRPGMLPFRVIVDRELRDETV
jgi:hypothetical protein